MTDVAFPKSSCIEVAAANCSIKLIEWYFQFNFRGKADFFIIERLADRPPNGGAFRWIEQVPESRHAAMVEVRC